MAFIFIAFLILFSHEDCCTMNTPDGKIDLTSLKGEIFTHALDFIEYHEVTLTLCQNLDDANKCVGKTSTTGPTPMKDEYNNGVDTECWYVGNLNKCVYDNSTWDKGESLSVMTMTGHKETDATRSLKLTIHCSTDLFPGKLDCSEAAIVDKHTTFDCHLYTSAGCPYEISHECYGYEPSDPKVCSGHGKCVDTNKCVCNDGYKGESCEDVDKATPNAGGVILAIILVIIILCVLAIAAMAAIGVVYYVLAKKGIVPAINIGGIIGDSKPEGYKTVE